MSKSLELLSAIASGNTEASNAAFSSLMRDKVSTGLDVRKVALTSEIYTEAKVDYEADPARYVKVDKKALKVDGDRRGYTEIKGKTYKYVMKNTEVKPRKFERTYYADLGDEYTPIK